MQNQARALHEAGMGKYSQFKKRVLEANLYLVGIGAGVAWTFGGSSIALDFACGGVAGIAYMSLLQHGTDSLALSGSPLSTMVSRVHFYHPPYPEQGIMTCSLASPTA